MRTWTVGVACLGVAMSAQAQQHPLVGKWGGHNTNTGGPIYLHINSVGPDNKATGTIGNTRGENAPLISVTPVGNSYDIRFGSHPDKTKAVVTLGPDQKSLKGEVCLLKCQPVTYTRQQ